MQDANNCYYLGHNSGTAFFIRKFVGGSFTNLSTFSSSIVAGDVFELSVVGNLLTAYRNGVAISGRNSTAEKADWAKETPVGCSPAALPPSSVP